MKKALVFLGVYGAIILIVILISTNRSSKNPEPSERISTIDTIQQEKAKPKNTIQKKKIESLSKDQLSKAKSENKYRKVTMDGYDPATGTIISPINLWSSYQERTYAGKVKHGEKVYMIKREGDGVLIETTSGIKGWVTYWFIKELN